MLLASVVLADQQVPCVESSESEFDKVSEELIELSSLDLKGEIEGGGVDTVRDARLAARIIVLNIESVESRELFENSSESTKNLVAEYAVVIAPKYFRTHYLSDVSDSGVLKYCDENWFVLDPLEFYDLTISGELSKPTLTRSLIDVPEFRSSWEKLLKLRGRDKVEQWLMSVCPDHATVLGACLVEAFDASNINAASLSGVEKKDRKSVLISIAQLRKLREFILVSKEAKMIAEKYSDSIGLCSKRLVEGNVGDIISLLKQGELSFIKGLKNPSGWETLISQAVNSFSQGDSVEKVSALMESFADWPELQNLAQTSVVSSSFEKKPMEALSVLLEMKPLPDDQLIANVIAFSSSYDIKKSLELRESMSEELKEKSAGVFAAAWLNGHPLDASQWISTLGKSKEKDLAIESLFKYLSANEEHDAAAKWIDEISDENLKAKLRSKESRN